MTEIEATIQISQHSTIQIEKIIEAKGEISGSLLNRTLTVQDEQQEIVVEMKKSSLYLFRKTTESTLEAQFDLHHQTKLVLSYSTSELVFDVVTTHLNGSENRIDLAYSLHAQQHKVGEYVIVFEIKL